MLGWEPEPVPQAHGMPVKEADEPRPRPQRHPKSATARWLQQTLGGQPREADVVRTLASRRGIEARELAAARRSVGVVTTRDESTGRVTWALPKDDAAGQGGGEAVRVAAERTDAVAVPAACS